MIELIISILIALVLFASLPWIAAGLVGVLSLSTRCLAAVWRVIK